MNRLQCARAHTGGPFDGTRMTTLEAPHGRWPISLDFPVPLNLTDRRAHSSASRYSILRGYQVRFQTVQGAQRNQVAHLGRSIAASRPEFCGRNMKGTKLAGEVFGKLSKLRWCGREISFADRKFQGAQLPIAHLTFEDSPALLSGPMKPSAYVPLVKLWYSQSNGCGRAACR